MKRLKPPKALRPNKSQWARRELVLETLARIETLQAELQVCTIERKEEVLRELQLLRRNQNRLSLKGRPTKNVAKLPQSFMERQKAAREASAKLSGRDKITARFVQGGSPGSGRNGR